MSWEWLTVGEPSDADERTQVQPATPIGNALSPGHVLRHFVIEALVGEGGFGIVYRARDRQLKRTVAIKEYMPASLAMRCADVSVAPRSARHAHTFARGLRSFIAEAQTLAGLERGEDALVEVHDFWEGNGTAYMVMRYYEGPTLQDWRRQQEKAPDEATLRALLVPLLDMLERLHAGDPPCYHRDIAPDNIMLLGPGRPLLLDFGAARRVIADATQDMSVVFKAGYAPVEQYESDGSRQGPWTDVYALCAVLHYSITGEAPPASIHRRGRDTLQPLAVRAAGRYSKPFLAGIDAGLQVLPEQRPQDVAALRRLLLPQADTRPGSEQGVGATAPVRRRLVLGGAAGVAMAGVAGAVWRLLGKEPPLPLPPALPPPSLPAAPFTLAAALQDIVDHANARFGVGVTLRKSRLTIGKDTLNYRVTSNVPGHVYVYLSDQTRLSLLFPDEFDRDNRIRALIPLDLPRRGPPLVALGPAGTSTLLVVVSSESRDLAAGGLRSTQDGGEDFDLAAVEAEWAATRGSGRRLLGKVNCPGGSTCDEAYGAALVHVDEI